MQPGEFGSAFAYDGEHETHLIAVYFGHAERAGHQSARIVGIHVDELRRLGMSRDEFVAECQSVHAIGQHAVVDDFDRVPAGEESRFPRLADGRHDVAAAVMTPFPVFRSIVLVAYGSTAQIQRAFGSAAAA